LTTIDLGVGLKVIGSQVRTASVTVERGCNTIADALANWVLPVRVVELMPFIGGSLARIATHGTTHAFVIVVIHFSMEVGCTALPPDSTIVSHISYDILGIPRVSVRA
jgi:hypothetical protein